MNISAGEYTNWPNIKIIDSYKFHEYEIVTMYPSHKNGTFSTISNNLISGIYGEN